MRAHWDPCWYLLWPHWDPDSRQLLLVICVALKGPREDSVLIFFSVILIFSMLRGGFSACFMCARVCFCARVRIFNVYIYHPPPPSQTHNVFSVSQHGRGEREKDTVYSRELRRISVRMISEVDSKSSSTPPTLIVRSYAERYRRCWDVTACAQCNQRSLVNPR